MKQKNARKLLKSLKNGIVEWNRLKAHDFTRHWRFIIIIGVIKEGKSFIFIMRKEKFVNFHTWKVFFFENDLANDIRLENV